MPKSAFTVEIKPWGSWLLPIRGERGIEALEDQYGRRWKGVREAFWVAELHMCGCSHEIVNQQLEHLGNVLTACSEPMHDRTPLSSSFEEGDSIHFMLYMHWLSAAGFIGHGDTPFDQVRLSDHGRSVLEMIRLTMPENPWHQAPRWFPEPKRPAAPRHERRRNPKLLPAPDATPA